MAIKIPNDLNYYNSFHSKAFQKIPKRGFLVWNHTIWQPWLASPDQCYKIK
jgi:hypothetical protein